MMKRIILCLLIGLMGCQEDTIIEAGPKGTLRGYVELDGTGSRGANVTITIEGTVPQVSVTTNGDGKFSVENLPTGTYDIVFKKSGYGTYKLVGYSFAGGNIPANVTVVLFRLPNVKIKELSMVASKSGSTWRVDGTALLEMTQPRDWPGKLRYYISKSPTVSSTFYEETGIVTTDVFTQSAAKFHHEINSRRFDPGSDVYFIAYPCTDDASKYIDIKTGNMIYCSIDIAGASPVKAFKVPS
jgi:hypothetical protein